MTMERGDRGNGYVAAAAGSFIGGVGSYILVALIAPMSISTEQFLSFDERGELELEGLTIVALLIVATLVAVVGCWFALRVTSNALAGATALVMLPLLAAAVITATGVRDRGPELAALATIIAAVVSRAVVRWVMSRWNEPPRPGAHPV